MKFKLIITGLIFVCATYASGKDSISDKTNAWDLKTCIDYARKNNIQLQKAKITVQESNVDLEQSKKALLPNLNAGSSLNFSNGKVEDDNGSYLNNSSLRSNYSISTGITLYDGLASYNTIKQNKLKTKVSELNAEETENSIVISITEAYLQLLYANENLKIAQRTAETSKANVALSQNLLDAGSISKADFSQVKAKYSSNLYDIITAKNNLETARLTLKQLLELRINDSIEIKIPEISDEEVMKLLPAKTDVYQRAVSIMPEIKSGNISVDVAKLDLEKAKSSYYPTLSLNAGINTGQNSIQKESFAKQLNGNLGQYAGLSLSIPIFDRGSAKASVQKAKLGIESAKLESADMQKELLKTIESVYQNAVSAQGKFQAAKVQLASADESYKLTEEQFKLGMKNTVQLLTEQDNYIQASQSLLQAKYGAILSQKLLDFYQNLSIE